MPAHRRHPYIHKEQAMKAKTNTLLLAATILVPLLLCTGCTSGPESWVNVQTAPGVKKDVGVRLLWTATGCLSALGTCKRKDAKVGTNASYFFGDLTSQRKLHVLCPGTRYTASVETNNGWEHLILIDEDKATLFTDRNGDGQWDHELTFDPSCLVKP